VFSGRLLVDSEPEGEELAVMQEAGLEDVIEVIDLADLGEEAEAMRAVLRRKVEVFCGLGKAEGEEFHIKVPPNIDISQINCPQHRRSEKERVLEKAEVTRLITLGVIEPSDALASTNSSLLRKRRRTPQETRSSGQRRTTGKSTSLLSRTATPCPLGRHSQLSLLASFCLHTRLASRTLGSADGDDVSEVYGDEDCVGNSPVCPDVNLFEERQRQRFLPTHDREHFAAISLAGVSHLSG
jgi:hypothetical protein